MPSQPTTIAGRFDVERAVGRGGMGTVWLCRDNRLGRQVAVKQVGRLPGESSTHLSRALREARSSAALNHPHVVAVYDAVEEGDHAWLVMEYVPSRTLAEIVAAEGALSPERACWIGAQAADGLAAAHAAGIIHRDVKPSNVLVTDDDAVKITDFGIARTHGHEALTRSGIVLGTPGYFSPELARGLEPQPAADVWALGATLFSAVEGHSAYPEQANALALLARIANDPIPPTTQAGFLAEPIARMMDPDPANRWSMGDAARVLRRLHQQHPVDETDGERTIAMVLPAAPVDRPTPDPEPEPEPEPMAATPTPADVPEPVLAPTPVARASAPATEESSRGRGALILLAVALLVAAIVGGFLLLGGDGDDDPDAATDGTPSRRAKASTSATSTDAPSPSPEPPAVEPPADPEESESSEPTEEESSSDVPAAGDPAAFATTYYGYLPSDTASAYALLSSDYRAGTSLGSYQGFWRTVSALEVGDVRVVNDTTVDVDLTYTTSGGRTLETQRLYLAPSGDGFVIVDDEQVG